MKLFDAHCHLQDAALFQNREQVLKRAVSAGVAGLAVCGTSPADWAAVFSCLEAVRSGDESGGILRVPLIGIHPWFVSAGWERNVCELERLVRAHPAAGIGETGLDFQDRFTNRSEQEASFVAHLELARELDRPIAVHCVHAWGRLLEILREHPAPRVQLHAFGGAPELVPGLVELNCWFSFGGSVTYLRSRRARASAAMVPADRLLIETDAPDLVPAGCDYPNEPGNLLKIARAVAELREGGVETVAEQIFHNAVRFFRISS